MSSGKGRPYGSSSSDAPSDADLHYPLHQPDSDMRFHEEKATDALKGADAPDLEAGVAAIRQTLATLPLRPGVYRMTDARGDVLYVGKARALKKRVANYTHINRLPRRIQRMVAQTRNMVIVTTESEAEALLLEAELIKRYRPAFNVLLRDDKSFPFILLCEDHDYPRMHKHRGRQKHQGQYFGPFANPTAVNITLNALQKIFLLRSCSDSYFANRSRPCLLYQIKRCSAPCVGRIEQPQYDALVEEARSFLSGKSSEVQARLAEQMQAASERLDFETAAILRDRLKALTYIQGSRSISADGVSDADIFAMAREGSKVCIQAFFIRAGQNWGHRSFFPAQIQDIEEDRIFASFLMQFYQNMPPPRMILLDRLPFEHRLVVEALEARMQHKLTLAVPQRGDKARLVDQAQRNANEALARKVAETASEAKSLARLAEIFELEAPPERIEIYDNSHIQGSNALGAMVVAGAEGFIKNAYRKFNFREEDQVTPGDDFAMMRAMLKRRFARAQEEDPDRSHGDWPDLVLIDGGRGQMSAVADALDELGIDDLVCVGVAKGPDRNAGREVFYLMDGRELTLPLNDTTLFYLQRLRDEAHRFAIGAHRGKRKKAMSRNSLDDIPGIGPARKKALLMRFGSPLSVRDATLTDLQKTPGISSAMAQQIYDYFQER